VVEPALWSRTAFISCTTRTTVSSITSFRRRRRPGTPGEFIDGAPIGLGFRVPCLVISPFSRGGFVCGDTFDHTSTLR
jgi:phospholipase C